MKMFQITCTNIINRKEKEDKTRINICPTRICISLQYLFVCYRGSHLNHHIVNKTPPLRRVRKDLHDLQKKVQRYKRVPSD